METIDINKTIIKMLQEEPHQAVIDYIKVNHREDKLKDSTLGKLFLAYVDMIGWEDKKNGISPEVTIEDLCKINKSFETENGCTWAANDRALGKVFKINRAKKKNHTYSVKLIGFNESTKSKRTIRADIKRELRNQRCVVLDTGVNIEIDHKNGRYDEERVSNTKTQKLEDFQPLHKSVNDAKRQHCKNCIQNKKRYDAKRLGYKEGWVYGDEDDLICKGCYWYDPKEFNKTISKDFVKEDKDSENIESQE